MHVVAIVGPSNAGKTTLVERLVSRLSDRGRVGTIKHVDCEPDLDRDGTDTARHRAAGAAVTHGLADDEWFATGGERPLDDALADLAPTCDYALVEGFRDLALPQIVLGEDATADGEREAPEGDRPVARDGSGGSSVLLSAPTADDVDLDAAVSAIESVDPHETVESLVAQATAAGDAERAGAVATFTGRVRARDDPDDERTEFLEFERHDGVAGERMATIREELEARDGVFAVRMHHKTGVVPAGEDVVHVVVLAGHRAEAFRTVEDGIDRLKEEVPLFKKEVTVSEEYWAHER